VPAITLTPAISTPQIKTIRVPATIMLVEVEVIRTVEPTTRAATTITIRIMQVVQVVVMEANPTRNHIKMIMQEVATITVDTKNLLFWILINNEQVHVSLQYKDEQRFVF